MELVRMRVIQSLLLLAVSSFAHAQSYEPATPEFAATVARLAVAAVKMRDEGSPREHLLSALIQQQGVPNRLGLEMRLIVDDIYSHPTVSGPAYFMYTLERFKRELAGKRFPKHFEELASPILACQQTHVASGDVAVNTCVVEAFIAFDTEPFLDRHASYMAARCTMAMGMVARSLAKTPEERAEGDRMVNTLLLAARGFGVSASEVDGWISEFGKDLAAAQYSADFLQTEAGACMSFMDMREQDLKLAAQRTCDSLEAGTRHQECK